MVPRYITAVAISVVLMSKSVAVYAGEAAGHQTSEPTAVELIETRCTFCHGQAVTLLLSHRVLEKGGAEALHAHLIKHHVPDEEARKAILDYLIQQTANSKHLPDRPSAEGE